MDEDSVYVNENKLDTTGKRWPVRGDKMRFLGHNGYDSELEEAKKLFNTTDEYTVTWYRVGGWRSSIAFEGFKGEFNSVMFEMVSK